MSRQFRWSFPFTLILLVILMAGMVPLKAGAAATIQVDGSITHQLIDGFGASGAFQMAAAIRNSPKSQQILDYLFDPIWGAGLTIVRNEIGSSANPNQSQNPDDGDNVASIAPTSGGSSSARLAYVWDANDPHVDGDQVWLSQQAQRYGVKQFIADAWSAPAYMKTNQTLKGGGYLCGTLGVPACASGDWRQAYADYLVQFLKFHHQVGIDYDYVGFVNEPDYSPGYTSMNLDATNMFAGKNPSGPEKLYPLMMQSADFIKNYLGPTLTASGLKTKISCCDATSWPDAKGYTDGLMADPDAAAYLALATGHAYNYGSGVEDVPFTSALNAGKKVWQTEVMNYDKPFATTWDSDAPTSGFNWAYRIWYALTKANVSGYLYWYFAGPADDNQALIKITGDTITVSSRLWAFANYSRTIRPGAVRLDTQSSDDKLYSSAYKNPDGTIAIVVLNGNTTDTSTSISLKNLTPGDWAIPYLTSADSNSAAQLTVNIVQNTLSATIPARSLVTYVIGKAGAPAPTIASTLLTPRPTATPTVTPTITPTPAKQAGQLAPDGIPGTTYYAAFPVTIKLDGDLSDWANVPRVTVDKGPMMPSSYKTTMTFAAVADNTNLYFLAKVKKDGKLMYGTHDAVTGWYKEDSVEFYLNTTGDLTLKSYKPGVVQIGIMAANITHPAKPIVGGSRSADAQVSVYAVQTADGYIVEASVPLVTKVWSIAPKHQEVLGFQVHLNGASDKTERDTKLIWSLKDVKDQSYQDPSVFGQLIFWEVTK